MSGSKGSSSQKSQAKTRDQQQWLREALNIYGPQLGQGENIFPGSTVAPFTSGQQAALNQSTDYLDAFAPGGEVPLFGDTQNAISGLLSGSVGAQPITQQQTSDYFQKAIQDPAYYRFQEGVKPLIEEQYAGPGFWGSARADAVTKAGTEMSDWLGQQRAQLEWDTLGANRASQDAIANRMLGAVPQGFAAGQMPMQLAERGLQGTADVFGFQGAGQQQRQSEINAAIQQFASENRITSEEDMAILMGLLGLNFSTSSGSSSNWGFGL
jgi:hypothetical protein